MRAAVLSRAGLLLCLLLFVAGCKAGSDDETTSTASINGYNSTDQAIRPFYVDEAGGTRIGAYAGGGSVCCVRYPRKWYPGLTARVKWATSSGKNAGDPTKTWHEAEVPIERYEQPGSLNIHFLPEGKVRILIWNGTPRSEGYPGPSYPAAPPGWSPKGGDDERPDPAMESAAVPGEVR
ncbi:DUF3304 domain-containing protein [Stenotrophomonas sp. Iso1]|uniref:DUF3304 domain-containing protein n=1 Tax=Stenotrophomonas sp. Iso1 TaxID=2977283 RepID=UPI0022B7D0C2|nr:DUF3304 domain-containing protein [Stenotrophomonas sp. Iso1]